MDPGPTSDPYLAVHNLGLLQRQAGVDPELAEIVVAFGRLAIDGGQPLAFDADALPEDLVEQGSYAELLAKNPRQDPRFLRFLAAYGGLLARKGLPPLYGVQHMARVIAISEDDLWRMSTAPARLYRRLTIPKKSGGTRRLFSPSQPLRGIQDWILRRILDYCPPHDAACGFVRGRSVLHGARLHVGKNTVLRIDIRDFFPSVSFRRVRKVFERCGYPYRVSRTLAGLCTLDGRLPQGAPTSPALSNLVCIRMDRRLSGLAESVGCAYSRYADDLIFSSDDRRLPRLIPLVREILREEEFLVNEEKTKIMRASRRQMVTGVVTNVRPSLPREHRRLLRAAVHRLRTRGPDAVSFSAPGRRRLDDVRVLFGHLAFLRMIDPDKARALESECVPPSPG